MQPESKRGARGGRGRGRGAGRGKRTRAAVISSDEEVVAETPTPAPVIATDPVPAVIETPVPEPVQPMETAPAIEPELVVEKENIPTIDIEADISQLEAPTFTTITRGPPEPMLRLKWTHKVLLIGEKVLNPMIHNCDTCLLPILHYGRMIPCKHVFCLACAKREPFKECPRCKEKVCRVEQSGLGTVFMCTHGGSRYNNNGCRRTYLSQRDLQAHINHRHVAVANNNSNNTQSETSATTNSSSSAVDTNNKSTPSGGGRDRKSLGNTTPSHPPQPQINTPAMSSVRTNLINMHENHTHSNNHNNEDGGHFQHHRQQHRYSHNNNSNYDNSGNWSNNSYR